MSGWARFFSLGVLAAFAAATFCAMESTPGQPSRYAPLAVLFLALAGALMVAWFLNSFVLTELQQVRTTPDPALTDIFAFAYVFTLLALALLAFPFGNLLDANSLPDTGPIRLLRGCVVPELSGAGDSVATVPMSSSAAASAEPASKAPSAASKNAPKPAATAGSAPPRRGKGRASEPTTASRQASVAAPGSQASGSASGSASGAGKSDQQQRQSDAKADKEKKNERDREIASCKWPKGLPTCSGDLRDVHTVLVSIGGVVARSQAASAPASASAVQPTPVYEVRDGFVVPLVMVVLALIGAAINLLRRIPEFQKRTQVGFIGTAVEAPLLPCEAREFTVLQVLQLLSAPLIVMVAVHVVAPQSLTTALALAFISGFSSETVLLRIRALVQGPEKTLTQATSQPPRKL